MGSPDVKFLLVMTFLVVLLVGCYDVSEYSGDGHLNDNGVFAATDRYVLNLGEVDLSRRGTKTYRIANLPEVDFVVGIEIIVNPEFQAIIKKRTINPVILLELSQLDGEIVFTKKANLNDWTWSVTVDEDRIFAYGRGESGTYFRPLPQYKYTLTITVLKSDPSHSEYRALLIAKSGGWK